MLGWVLSKYNTSEVTKEMYEKSKLISEAKKYGIKLIMLKPQDIDLIVTKDDRKSVLVNGKPTPLPDFILPRMGAGTTYFALAVIRHMERLGVPCFSSSASIDTVKDKLYTQQILAENNFPVPKTMLAKFPIDIELVESTLGFPVVMKTLSGSQGNGVFLAKTKADFINIIGVLEVSKSNVNIILQEYIKDSHGRDLRVFTIGGKAVACMERRSSTEDFKANFSQGGSVFPYTITPEIEWLATEATRILGLDISGVDLLFDGDHFKICEVNSSPGFKGLEKTCDVNIPKEIFHYIRIRLGNFT